ncbi:hypothetical protein C8Q73DRAFT_174355 [Cubamyces lactineus]|nr:hypothetical protein C8Q73DRAFT_174355 [Cubamyces lactineus]
MMLRRVVHNWFGRHDSRKEPFVISENEDDRMDVDMGPLDSPAATDEPPPPGAATKAPVSKASYCSAVELLPAEVLERILLEAWLDIPLQSPVDRWTFFANLSLVSRKFRKFALWIAARHVRVIGHSSMDIDAYRNIGRQQLSMNGDTSADPDASLAALFRFSTVYLDITYAKRWMYKERDRWLRDDVFPGRPDDNLPPVFDGLHVLQDPSPEEHQDALPERPDGEYLEWLRRRRRDRLSGWFADLLEVVPDCAAADISAADEDTIDTLFVKTYGTLLESLLWWPSLSALYLSVLPGRPSCMAELSGSALGPPPFLPALPTVKTVGLSRYPGCFCFREIYVKREAHHSRDCITRRILQPYPNLKTLYLDTAPDFPDDVVFHPNSQPQVVLAPLTKPTNHTSLAFQEGTPVDPDELDALIRGGVGETEFHLTVPGLKLSKFDSLWEIIRPGNRQQPTATSFGGYPAPGEGEDFLFYP